MKTRAAVVREINKLTLETVELSAPKENEVLVRVRGIPEGVELVRVDPETVLATPVAAAPPHH